MQLFVLSERLYGLFLLRWGIPSAEFFLPVAPRAAAALQSPKASRKNYLKKPL